MKAVLVRLMGITMVLALASCGGGGGGGGDAPPLNQAPQISNLLLSQTTFNRDTSGQLGSVSATIDYTDPEADIVEVRVQIDDGPVLSLAVQGPIPTSGQLIGQIDFSLAESGVFTAEVWVVDAAGNSSNRLTATITIVGDTTLSDLAISAASFDQAFRASFTGDYTAVVGVSIDSTTVTATADDPNSTIEVNGEELASGGTTGPIALTTGLNEIDVVITTIDGSRSTTYTIRVLRNALDLAQSNYVKASNTDFDDRFAESLALAGDTLVVTSRLEDSVATGINGDQADNSASNAGAAYLFTRGAGGDWVQQAYIKASNSESSDFFGSSVAISGDTLAIGAVWERSSATGVNGDQDDNSVLDAGAAYVFSRDVNGLWSQTAYIKASNTGQLDLFGNALALDGDTLVVGAFGEWSAATGVNGDQSDNSAELAGATYVYTRDGAGAWSQQAYLKASDTDSIDQFGSALALDGDTLVVGAPESFLCTGCDTTTETGGKVYVFVRDAAATWTQQAMLQPANVERFHRFGSAVALEGDMLVVGAPEGGINNSGAVYVYTRDGSGSWSEQAQLSAHNTDLFDKFGSDVDLRNGVLLVGASGEDNQVGLGGSGAAYVFARDALEQWEQRMYLRADNREEGDAFGSTVAIGEGFFVVGAMFEGSGATGINGDQTDNSARDSGAAYVFE